MNYQVANPGAGNSYFASVTQAVVYNGSTTLHVDGADNYTDTDDVTKSMTIPMQLTAGSTIQIRLSYNVPVNTGVPANLYTFFGMQRIA